MAKSSVSRGSEQKQGKPVAASAAPAAKKKSVSRGSEQKQGKPVAASAAPAAKKRPTAGAVVARKPAADASAAKKKAATSGKSAVEKKALGTAKKSVGSSKAVVEKKSASAGKKSAAGVALTKKGPAASAAVAKRPVAADAAPAVKRKPATASAVSAAKKGPAAGAAVAKRPVAAGAAPAVKRRPATASAVSAARKGGAAKDEYEDFIEQNGLEEVEGGENEALQQMFLDEKAALQEDIEEEKNKKKTITFIAIVIIILLLLLGGVGIAVSRGGRGGNASAKERQNTLALAQKYIDKGQYDDAMGLLNGLLQKDINDEEADALLDKAIELKKQNQSEGGGGGTVIVQQGAAQPYNINIDTNEITNALREQNERNQETINRLLAEQQRLNDEAASARAEESAQAQKALEEQRKKEEAERAAKEEALAKKNKALKSKIDAINEKIRAGKADLNTGGLDSALSNFNAAVAMLPLEEGEPEFSAQKNSEIALALFEAGQNEKDGAKKQKLNNAAINYVNKTLAADPNDAAAHYILGMNYFEAKDWERAQKEFSAAVKSDTNNWYYYYMLGRAQFRLRKFTEAKTAFETSIKLKKDYAPTHYNLGVTHNRLNSSRAALNEFRLAHQYDPHHVNSYLEEARVLNKSFNDPNGAINAYKQAISIDPVNTQALNECGMVYADLGKYADAESYHRRAVALIKPGESDPITYYNLATALYKQKKLGEAETNAKTAYDQKDAKRADGRDVLRSKSMKAMIVYNYALVEDELGKSDKAITLYKEVLIIDPDHSKAKTNLGKMFMNMSPPDADSALVFYLDAYKVEQTLELENNLGSAYLAKKDYGNAITYFQSAHKRNPKDNGVRFNLAKAYSGAGEFENAKTIYLEVLNSDSNNFDAYIEVAKVFLALKDTASAEAYLKILQQKNPTYKKAEVDALLNASSVGSRQ